MRERLLASCSAHGCHNKEDRASTVTLVPDVHSDSTNRHSLGNTVLSPGADPWEIQEKLRPQSAPPGLPLASVSPSVKRAYESLPVPESRCNEHTRAPGEALDTPTSLLSSFTEGSHKPGGSSLETTEGAALRPECQCAHPHTHSFTHSTNIC